MTRFLLHLRKVLWHAFDDDVVNTSKAVAYSGMLMMFPALMVIATLLAQGPEGTTLVGEFRSSFEQFLPADSMDLLQYSLHTHRTLSAQLVLSGTGLSAFAALGAMLSLMEGFRRAYRLPREIWGFWERRGRALLLIFIALVPMSLATLAIIFGRQIEAWMIDNSRHELRHIVLFFWRMVRWAVALVTSITVLSALYHFGAKKKEHWARVVPGAIASALAWFLTTLAFGFYVTRIANYSMFYGSFGAGIATLVWLYITSFSALLGAEINGVLFRERKVKDPSSGESDMDSSGL
ncbi:MAG: YihY/virulence factor BrkB family protein [Terracidiphilus sp.]|jgi:membrane protein